MQSRLFTRTLEREEGLSGVSKQLQEMRTAGVYSL